MELLRAKVELDYTDITLRCNNYPHLFEDPTILTINDEEYPAIMTIVNKPNSYSFIIKIDVCKDG